MVRRSTRANSPVFTALPLAAALLALGACGGSGFGGSKSSASDAQKEEPRGGVPEPGEPKNANDGNDDDAVTQPVAQKSPTAAPIPTAPPGAKESGFALAAETRPPSDVLFVIDDSSSMVSILGTVAKGFESLTPNSFPLNSRVGVMYTLPGNPQNLASPHPKILEGKSYASTLAKAPGFLRLVSKTTIGNYLAQSGLPSPNQKPMSAQFPVEGCAEWFAPDAKNSKGERCFKAAVQAPLLSVGCEAGVAALDQLLKVRTQTFRAGSDVNIVFLSDTHDPGCAHEDIAALAPSAAQLKANIVADSKPASVTFHAIAPEAQCATGGEPITKYGKRYSLAADATGGIKVDICKETNYTKVFERIGQGVKVYPFDIPGVKKVHAVKVDGVALPASEFSLGINRVNVKLAPSTKPRDVKISWE